jgi:DNA-directed RNA polymerase subunit K/omega
VSAPPAAPHPLLQEGSNTDTVGNRFLLSAVAFLRSKQIQAGATARVARDGHKPTYLAVLEVLADTVTWTRVPVDAHATGS